SILSAPVLVIAHPLSGGGAGNAIVAAGGVTVGHPLSGSSAGSSVSLGYLTVIVIPTVIYLAPRPVMSLTSGKPAAVTLVAARPVTGPYEGSGP
ncbi:MAG: hypothetical protein M3Q75_07345, partial [Gemmatimonadota bacterium]|nr:hypothetical protein [Gemmatimonadota bacterium]